MLLLTIKIIKLTSRRVLSEHLFPGCCKWSVQVQELNVSFPLAAVGVVKSTLSFGYSTPCIPHLLLSSAHCSLKISPLSVSPSGSLGLRWWIPLQPHLGFFFPTPHMFFEIWFSAALGSSGDLWRCSPVWTGCVTSIISVLFRPLIHCKSCGGFDRALSVPRFCNPNPPCISFSFIPAGCTACSWFKRSSS